MTQDGKVGQMGEGPHPCTTQPKPTHVYGNIGNVAGKRIGVKSIVRQASDGNHHKMWIDKTATGNSWKEQHNGPSVHGVHRAGTTVTHQEEVQIK